MLKVSPADHQGQRDTGLTLTPFVSHNSNYVIMVNYLKLFKMFLHVFCTVIIRCTETVWSPCISKQAFEQGFVLGFA
jgi:hypothetical protein